MKSVDLLKALSDELRLQILHIIKDKETCVCELMDVFDMPQSSLSHHLGILKKEGLVKVRKEGKWSYYSLDLKDKPDNQKLLFNTALEMASSELKKLDFKCER